MSAHDPKSRLMGLGVFLLPLLLVKGTALMVGQPPQGASGAVGGISTPDGVIETFTPDWTLEQIAAAHRVAELQDLPFGESPLLHARRVDDIDPIDHVDPVPRVIKPPDVAVKMILRSSRGNVALIDGKYYRTGDAIGAQGWIVEDIDPKTRSVFIMHPPSGQEATLNVPMPR